MRHTVDFHVFSVWVLWIPAKSLGMTYCLFFICILIQAARDTDHRWCGGEVVQQVLPVLQAEGREAAEA